MSCVTFTPLYLTAHKKPIHELPCFCQIYPHLTGKIPYPVSSPISPNSYSLPGPQPFNDCHFTANP